MAERRETERQPLEQRPLLEIYERVGAGIVIVESNLDRESIRGSDGKSHADRLKKPGSHSRDEPA